MALYWFDCLLLLSRGRFWGGFEIICKYGRRFRLVVRCLAPVHAFAAPYLPAHTDSYPNLPAQLSVSCRGGGFDSSRRIDKGDDARRQS